MNVLEFQRILTSRWWVILAAFIVAVAGALVYAGDQQTLYQASATVFAHPSGLVDKPVDINADAGLLTYGTLAETFASLAQSQHMLSEAGKDMGMPAATLAQYSVAASTVPQTTVLQVSVNGPNALGTARLADALVRRVAADTSGYFRTIALTPLDSAKIPTTPIQPQTSHYVLYAGLAGLLIGFIIAVFSVYRPVPESQMLSRETISPVKSQGEHARTDVRIPAR